VRVGRIRLRAYRNYAELDLPITANLCVFVGANAQGKTNLLEAVYFVATGRSFRTSRDDDLIAWDQSEAGIECAVQRAELADDEIRIRLVQGRPKIITVNGRALKRHADLFGYLNVVMFSPDDLQLIKGSPAERRRFLDVELAQVSPTYRHDLLQYAKVLRQRNNLLKEIAERRAEQELLSVWDEQLMTIGSRIMAKRAEAVLRLSALGSYVHRDITQGSEQLSIRYRPFFAAPQERERSEGEWERVPVVQERFRHQMNRLRQAELARAQTLVGPQRDDLQFQIDGYDVRSFGSQGQQRTAVLSCKLAEIEFMRSETGEYPVLLLDDVMSELDARRRHYFLGTVNGRVQTFITTTSLNDLSTAFLAQAQIARIEAGRVMPSAVA
jgi:DNA replication and repair protein RecF